jgi:hypothetical protein
MSTTIMDNVLLADNSPEACGMQILEVAHNFQWRS